MQRSADAQSPKYFFSQLTNKLMTNPVKIQDVKHDGQFLTIDESEIPKTYKQCDLPIQYLPELKKEIATFLLNTTKARNTVSQKNMFIDAKNETPDLSIPVYIIGSQESGQSCLINKLTTGKFSPIHNSTGTIDYASFNYKIDTHLLNLYIADIPSRNDNRIWSNLRSSSPLTTIIIVVDITNRQSIEGAQKSYDRARKTFNSKSTFILVSTKNDLEQNRVISQDELNIFSEKNSMAAHFETSAKDPNNDNNVIYPFIFAAKRAFGIKNAEINLSTLLIQLEEHASKIQDSQIHKALFNCCNQLTKGTATINYAIILDELESAFKQIINFAAKGQYNNFFGSRNNQFTSQQLDDIAVLKKMFTLITQCYVVDITLSENDKLVLNKLVEHSELIDFNCSRFDVFTKDITSSRDIINSLVGNPNSGNKPQ